MTRLSLRRACLLLLTIAAVPGLAQTLDHGNLEKWRSYIRPEGDEPWRELPWHASFLDGVVKAGTDKKPVLLWAMSGHPLGCT